MLIKQQAEIKRLKEEVKASDEAFWSVVSDRTAEMSARRRSERRGTSLRNLVADPVKEDAQLHQGGLQEEQGLRALLSVAGLINLINLVLTFVPELIESIGGSYVAPWPERQKLDRFFSQVMTISNPKTRFGPEM